MGTRIRLLGALGVGAGMAVWRHGAHRTRSGAVAPAGPDAMLVLRVKAKVARYASHPAAIAVSVEDGRVVLSGAILEREVDDMVAAIGRLTGVRAVDNRLSLHQASEAVPALRGGHRLHRLSAKADWAQDARLIAGTGGGLLALWVLRRRGTSVRATLARLAEGPLSR